MTIDLGSFAYGAILENGVGTPSWGTALGQSSPEYYITREGSEEIVMGMVYCSVPLNSVSLPLGRGGKVYNCIEAGTIQIASVFHKVFVNGKPVQSPFIMVLQKEDSNSHSGRRSIKYTDKTTYENKEGNTYSNTDFVSCVQKKFGLSDNACWFVYDISVKNYEELHLKAIFVNKENSENYRDSHSRSEKWTALIESVGDKYNIRYRAKTANSKTNNSTFYPFLPSLRTKPFMLLAGISGTGKSRIVRKLAQATVTEELQRAEGYEGADFARDRWTLHAPANFELIQVKPNWHNSMDVTGYLSNIPSPHYVFTPFVEFVVKAWQHPDVPFFLCLDEMNLAPVEEYFAEFLSAIESRSFEGGEYTTDPIIKPFNSFGSVQGEAGAAVDVGRQMVNALFPDYKAGDTGTEKETLIKRLREKGLTLPQNLIVIGTVNMDETTFSFSRKVLDRAMSVEMNEVNYDSFLADTTDDGLKAIVAAFEAGEYGEGVTLNGLLTRRHIEAKEIVGALGDDAAFAIGYLKRINALLEGTPFKLGYRAANEALIYLLSCREFGMPDRAAALDRFTLMKILSRIEGDESKLKITDSEADKERTAQAGVDEEDALRHGDLNLLTALRSIITQYLGQDSEEVQTAEGETETNDADATDEAEAATEQKGAERWQSVKKIDNMLSQLRRDHFVSYWN